MTIINIACLVVVWIALELLRRERQQHKNRQRELTKTFIMDAKQFKSEYKRLYASYERREAQVYAKLVKDIQEELKGLNGRVTTPEEARRKTMLNNTLEYIKER